MIPYVLIVWLFLCTLVWRSRRRIVSSCKAFLLCEFLPVAVVILVGLLALSAVIDLIGSGRLRLEDSRKAHQEKWSPRRK